MTGQSTARLMEVKQRIESQLASLREEMRAITHLTLPDDGKAYLILIDEVDKLESRLQAIDLAIAEVMR